MTEINFALQPKQLELLNTQANEILGGGAAGGGKAVKNTTKTKTCNGYVEIKDIHVGDKVYDERNILCTVIEETDIMYDRPCFEVEFDCGTSVVCDALHLWSVFAEDRTMLTLTTGDIYDMKESYYVIRYNNGIPSKTYISSVKPVESVPVKCIRVDSPSNTFQITEFDIVTHNSYAMRVASIVWSLEVKGLQVYLFRRKYADLVKNHLYGSGGYMELLAPLIDAGVCKVIGDEKIKFENGSIIWLCHCQYVKDMYNYHGAEIHVLMIDELTTFEEEIYRYLRNRVRIGGLDIPEHYKGFFPRILSGSNPGNIGHCLPYGEVLTPDKGWVDIQDFSVGDAVYSVDENGTLVETTVDQVHKHKSNKLVNVSSRGLTMSMTPEHKIAKVSGTKGDKNKKFSLVKFDDLPGQTTVLRSVDWHGVEIGDFKPEPIHTRKRKLNQPKSISGKQYAEFMGWFLSEGCSIDTHKSVSISQIKGYNRVKIEMLLSDCGFKYRSDKIGFMFCAPDWWNYLKRFGKCRDKYIPKRILNATQEELSLFFNAAVDGDGHWSSKKRISGSYYTTSKKLADGMQEVCMKLGYITYMSSRQRKDRDGLSYCISFKKTKSGGSELLTGNHLYNVDTHTKRRSDISIENGSFDTYCLGIENTHTFLVRQNGSVWVSGNSWVKATFIDPAKPYEIWKTPDDEGGMNRVFIPARLQDNKVLTENDPGYAKRLAGLGDPDLVRAMLEGDWDIAQGAFFGAVWDVKKLVIPSFDFENVSWACDRSYDWGLAKPSAVCWFLESDGSSITYHNPEEPDDIKEFWMPKGSLIMFDEYYTCTRKNNEGNGELARQTAQYIKEKEDKWNFMVNPGPADTAIYKTEYNDGNIASDMRDEGITWTRADKSAGSRANGWAKMAGMMFNACTRDPERPWLVFMDKCKHTIRTLPALPRDASKAEDIDSNSEDHLADAIRYRVGKPNTRVYTGKVGGL